MPVELVVSIAIIGMDWLEKYQAVHWIGALHSEMKELSEQLKELSGQRLYKTVPNPGSSSLVCKKMEESSGCALISGLSIT
ncbi:hypothetical protein Tco_0750649 [Tanacetum coccineum]|uniref:Uncharacterized protein n=1 Tax=Tanacetum coccineum TaxID=301880 RepID=A0ABQ4Z586_9ASTR